MTGVMNVRFCRGQRRPAATPPPSSADDQEHPASRHDGNMMIDAELCQRRSNFDLLATLGFQGGKGSVFTRRRQETHRISDYGVIWQSHALVRAVSHMT